MLTTNNDMTIYSAQVSLDPKSFKSKKLYEYALRINAAREAAASVVLNAAADAKLAQDKFEREAGFVLSEVQDAKAYAADGYKSAADFAAAVFGLNKSDCSSYIRAYKMRKAYPELDSMPRTNIDRLSAADSKSVKEAIANKELTPGSTQDKLKTFVADHPAKPKKAKVVPTFNIYAPNKNCPSEFSMLIGENVKEDDFKEVLTDAKDGKPDRIVKLKGDGIPGTFIIPVWFTSPQTTLFAVKPYVKSTPKADKADRAARMTELLDAFKAGQMDYDTFRAAMESLA